MIENVPEAKLTSTLILNTKLVLLLHREYGLDRLQMPVNPQIAQSECYKLHKIL